MNMHHANSSPDLFSLSLQNPDESTLEENARLLQKMIQDYTDASRGSDACSSQCIIAIVTILDDLKSRVQKLQPVRQRQPGLRRCNTDLRCGAPPPREKKHRDPPTAEDAQKLRRDLFNALNARRSLEKMFCSLGREKDLIAAELARRVRQLGEAEELVEDLRVQNETLLEKVKAYAAHHQSSKDGAAESRVANSLLQERNKALAEQLMKSIDGYRGMQRRLAETQEENGRVVAVAEEAAEVAAAGVGVVRGLIEKMDDEGGDGKVEEMNNLEKMLVELQGKLGRVGN